MSKQHFDESSAGKFTLTVFLSFVAIFCFVMLMMQWRGGFKPGENENAAVRVTETTESPNEQTANMTGDSTGAMYNDSTRIANGDSAGKKSRDSIKKKSSDTTGIK